MARHIRQQHDANGDADDGERQLIEAVGIVELRHRPRLHRRDHGADHDVELRDAARDHAGDAQRDQPTDSLGHARAAQAQPKSDPVHAPDEVCELQNTGDRDAEGLRDAAVGVVLEAQREADEDCRGQHEVEDDRDRRTLGEAPEGVQHARHQCDERHAEQVRESDPGQQHREIKLRRIVAETGRQQIHQPRHENHGECREGDQNQHQPGHRFFGEGARRVLALAFKALGEQRDERRVECTLAEQSPEEVRKPECDVEGVGHPSRAKCGCEQDVADEAQDAAQHGETADSGEGAVEFHGSKRLPGFVAKSKAAGRSVARGRRVVARTPLSHRAQTMLLA